VDTSAIVEIPDDFTASFFVSTDGSQNQIAMFYTGAMTHAHKLSFKEHARGDTIDLVVISPNDPRAMVQYVRECKELHLPYIYDPSQQIIRLDGVALTEGVRGSAITIVNEYEFEMLKNKTDWSDEEIAAETQALIVTRGEKGSVIRADGKIIHIPIVPARRIADPTGVGDAYRAGIIKGYLKKLPWEITGRLGSLAATYALEECGTQSHRYSLQEFSERFHETFGTVPVGNVRARRAIQHHRRARAHHQLCVYRGLDGRLVHGDGREFCSRASVPERAPRGKANGERIAGRVPCAWRTEDEGKVLCRILRGGWLGTA
jgi:adenosine kinase